MNLEDEQWRVHPETLPVEESNIKFPIFEYFTPSASIIRASKPKYFAALKIGILKEKVHVGSRGKDVEYTRLFPILLSFGFDPLAPIRGLKTRIEIVKELDKIILKKGSKKSTIENKLRRLGKKYVEWIQEYLLGGVMPAPDAEPKRDLSENTITRRRGNAKEKGWYKGGIENALWETGQLAKAIIFKPYCHLIHSRNAAVKEINSNRRNAIDAIETIRSERYKSLRDKIRREKAEVAQKEGVAAEKCLEELDEKIRKRERLRKQILDRIERITVTQSKKYAGKTVIDRTFSIRYKGGKVIRQLSNKDPIKKLYETLDRCTEDLETAIRVRTKMTHVLAKDKAIVQKWEAELKRRRDREVYVQKQMEERRKNYEERMARREERKAENAKRRREWGKKLARIRRKRIKDLAKAKDKADKAEKKRIEKEQKKAKREKEKAFLASLSPKARKAWKENIKTLAQRPAFFEAVVKWQRGEGPMPDTSTFGIKKKKGSGNEEPVFKPTEDLSTSYSNTSADVVSGMTSDLDFLIGGASDADDDFEVASTEAVSMEQILKDVNEKAEAAKKVIEEERKTAKDKDAWKPVSKYKDDMDRLTQSALKALETSKGDDLEEKIYEESKKSQEEEAKILFEAAKKNNKVVNTSAVRIKTEVEGILKKTLSLRDVVDAEKNYRLVKYLEESATRRYRLKGKERPSDRQMAAEYERVSGFSISLKEFIRMRRVSKSVLKARGALDKGGGLLSHELWSIKNQEILNT